jgi:hypothetical protein
VNPILQALNTAEKGFINNTLYCMYTHCALALSPSQFNKSPLKSAGDTLYHFSNPNMIFLKTSHILILWFGFEMSPKSSCVEGSVPSEAVFRDGAFGR